MEITENNCGAHSQRNTTYFSWGGPPGPRPTPSSACSCDRKKSRPRGPAARLRVRRGILLSAQIRFEDVRTAMEHYLALFEPDLKAGGYTVTFPDFGYGV